MKINELFIGFAFVAVLSAPLQALPGANASIKTFSYSVSPVYNNPPAGQSAAIVGHMVTNSVEVTLTNLTLIEKVLTEAAVLTGLGGLIGMTSGWSISFACRMIFPSLPTAVPLWAAALGVVVSVAVGLFFGIWPANKAVRLDPVVALRYE